MLKINKDTLIIILNNIILCSSIITLGILFRMIYADYHHGIHEIEQGKIFLEKAPDQR